MFEPLNHCEPFSLRIPSSNRDFTCDICGRPHGNMSELIQHRNVHSLVGIGIPTSITNDFGSIQLSKYAFDGHISEYDMMSHEPCSDVLQFFQMSEDLIRSLFRDLSPKFVIKARMILRARFFKINDKGKRTEEFFLFFPSHPQSYVHREGQGWFASHTARMCELYEKASHQSSNIEFDSIDRVYVKLTLMNNQKKLSKMS